MTPNLSNSESIAQFDTRRDQAHLRRQGKDDPEHTFGEIVGQSPALRAMEYQIELVAPTNTTVLILGESGTGKDLVAHEIHKRSQRRDRRLVRVNCASITRELYESEFFGHVKGAYTGALNDRAGRFELADGGTLFLDEVGEIPLDLQSKLLRAIQEGEYERVGEETSRKVNVRIIGATNRSLQKEVEAGRFRQDLYYRLNVYPIPVVALRHRKEDILVLAKYFIAQAIKKLKCPPPQLPQPQVVKLQEYDWPGNVRELQNVIERAIIVSQGNPLQFDLPRRASVKRPGTQVHGTIDFLSNKEVISEAEMRQWERDNLIAALRRSQGRIYGPGGAAQRLGIKPSTLVSRIKKLAVKKLS